MILPRRRVIGVFFSLALIVQLGYYFEFLEFNVPPVILFEFRSEALVPSIPLFLPHLNAFCNKTKPLPGVYINCSTITMPSFKAINQLQVCIRWAMDAGVGIIKPKFIIHDNITGIPPERVDIDYLLDESHLWQALETNCPWLKVVESSEIDDKAVELVGDTYFYGKFYRKGSYNRYLQTRLRHESLPTGTTIVMREDASFCGWERRRDPAPIQLSFKHLFRFNRSFVTIANRILPNLPLSFFGLVISEDVYEDEWLRDKLLDQVLLNNKSVHPVVYLACDNERAMTTFAQRAQERGVNATNRWALTHDVDSEWMIKTLSIEQMRLVDHLVLQQALYVFGSVHSFDAYVIGMDRHITQFGELDYHSIDRQQNLFGKQFQIWDGNTW